jgi:hypothetical protein
MGEIYLHNYNLVAICDRVTKNYSIEIDDMILNIYILDEYTKKTIELIFEWLIESIILPIYVELGIVYTLNIYESSECLKK